jgi:hypothetical protein
MSHELTIIDVDHLAAACGGTVATSRWTQLETDLQGRIDGQIAQARTRLDHLKTTMPTLPSVPTTPYSHCFPIQTAKR